MHASSESIYFQPQTSQQDLKCPTFKESAQRAPKQIQRQLIHQEINSAPWATCTEQPCPWVVGCLKARVQVKNCPSSWKCRGPAVNDPEANPCQSMPYFPPVKTLIKNISQDYRNNCWTFLVLIYSDVLAAKPMRESTEEELPAGC